MKNDRLGKKLRAGKLDKLSLLYKNTLSTASLILLACVVIGVILLNSSASELRRQDEQQTDARIALVMNDLNNQIKLMREGAARVATTAIYRPVFRSRSPLDELDLIEDLQKYDAFSLLSESCFLLYSGESMVYNSSAKNDFYVCVNKLGVADHTELYDRIVSVRELTVLKRGDRIFFVCPVFFYDRNAATPNAWLCFVSSKNSLIHRVTDVSGGFDCGWSVGIDDCELARFGEAENSGKPALASNDSGFWFEVYQREGRFNYFTLVNAGFVLLIAVALLGVTAVVTYKNYLPLKRIVDKYPREDDGIQNELEYIDRLINESHLQQKTLREDINRQRMVIARQLLTAMFRGERPEREIVEDIFQFDSFAVLAIRLSAPDLHAVTDAIEALSGGGITFYCVRLEQLDCFACAACFDGTPRIAEAKELVEAAIELCDSSYSIGASIVYDISDGTRAALMSALDAGRGSEKDASSVSEPPDGALLTRITAEITTGSEQSALACLKRYAELIYEPGQPSRLLCGELVASLLRTASALKTPADAGRLELALELTDSAEVYEALTGTVRGLCESVVERRSRNRSEQFDRILEYINEHALDYDLDQDRVAERFGITSNSLYRMFKTQLGDNYKHYVTGLRINAACGFLAEGHSVQEVCLMIGYTNVSYFIKTFKSITGYTPNNYKNQGSEQAL